MTPPNRDDGHDTTHTVTRHGFIAQRMADGLPAGPLLSFGRRPTGAVVVELGKARIVLSAQQQAELAQFLGRES